MRVSYWPRGPAWGAGSSRSARGPQTPPHPKSRSASSWCCRSRHPPASAQARRSSRRPPHDRPWPAKCEGCGSRPHCRICCHRVQRDKWRPADVCGVEPGARDQFAGQTGSRGGCPGALPDGRELYVRCSGTGSPTVILEAGDLDSTGSYAFAERDLAAVTRTCVYDRANLGSSDPAPGPRQLSDLVADLEGWIVVRGKRVRSSSSAPLEAGTSAPATPWSTPTRSRGWCSSR